jgi:hypothetical protein
MPGPSYSSRFYHPHKISNIIIIIIIIIITKKKEKIGVNSAGNVLSRTYVMEIPEVSCTKKHRVTLQTQPYI